VGGGKSVAHYRGTEVNLFHYKGTEETERDTEIIFTPEGTKYTEEDRTQMTPIRLIYADIVDSQGKTVE